MLPTNQVEQQGYKEHAQNLLAERWRHGRRFSHDGEVVSFLATVSRALRCYDYARGIVEISRWKQFIRETWLFLDAFESSDTATVEVEADDRQWDSSNDFSAR